MKSVDFTAVANQLKPDVPWAKVGVWTDGIGVYADNDALCAFPLKPGKKYKVTIEEVEV